VAVADTADEGALLWAFANPIAEQRLIASDATATFKRLIEILHLYKLN
jgi:hypothetical protein